MDHKTFASSLDVETREHLLAKSDRAGIKRLSAHLGWILVLACYVIVGAPLWGLALIPLGICIVFLFTLLHETVHETPFASKRINMIVGKFCSLVLGIPTIWFRYFHLAHHKHTNDPAHDPELRTPKPETKAKYFIHISGVPYWIATASVLWAQARGRVEGAYIPDRQVTAIVREARLMLAFYIGVTVLILMGWSWLFWCWLLPSIIGQPFLRLYLLAEHGHCPAVSNMFENTRTTFTNRMVRFIAWNMPYHAEHHAMPSVPFHKLPKLHDLAKPHLKSTSEGYTEFHRGYVKEL